MRSFGCGQIYCQATAIAPKVRIRGWGINQEVSRQSSVMAVHSVFERQVNQVTVPVSIKQVRDSPRLWRAAYWFVPAAMVWALVRYAEAGWGFAGNPYSYELVAAGILLQGWLPVMATWWTRRTGAGLGLFARLVSIQAATGIAMAALYVLILIVTPSGANPWQMVDYYAKNPGVALTIVMVIAFSWALTGVGMLVGAATRKGLALWPAAIMAAVLVLAYLTLWWGRIPNPILLDFRSMQFAWFHQDIPLRYAPPGPSSPAFLWPCVVSLLVAATTTLTAIRLSGQRELGVDAQDSP